MDDTPIDEAPVPRPVDAIQDQPPLNQPPPNQPPPNQPFDREQDLAILEGLEAELAEVEAALHRLDTDDAPEPRGRVEPQT
jgi:hypothetical protein